MANIQMQMEFQRDLNAPLLVQTAVTLLKEGDSAANVLVIRLYRGKEEADVSGSTVSGYLLRADGARVPLTGSVSGNTVTVEMDEHCYLVPGPYGAFVRLISGETKRTILEIAGEIKSEGDGPVVDIGEKFVTIEEIIEQMDAMKQVTEEASEAAENANAAAADADNAAEAANGAAENANKWANAEANATSVSAGGQPTVSVTEVNGKKEISFGIPAGITPSITFNVATGEPGTQVEVSQSGTPEAPVVNLTIPRGDTGAVDGIDYYSGTPSALGEGSPGTSNEVARGDHVHPIPSASDVGALSADGTATDSSKLGGKPPEYYIQPVNLLGNSNFTNPVNQRGQTSYTAVGYTIDRWYTSNANSVITNGDGYLAIASASGGASYVRQWIQSGVLELGKTYSLAICDNDGAIYVRSGELIEGISIPPFYPKQNSTGAQIGVRFEYDSGKGCHNVMLSTSNTLEYQIKWLALYEGSYTADTLPPYVPKGYVTELMECQRRCVPMYGSARYRASRVLADYLYFEIPLPVIMEKTPEISNTKNTIGVGSITGNATKDYTFSVSSMNATSVQIRAEKEGHGLTDAYLVFEGTTSKDGAFLLAEV